MGCRGTAASPQSSSWAAGKYLLWNLENLLLNRPLCLQSCSYHVFTLLTSLATITLFSLLEYVIREALLPSLMDLASASSGSTPELFVIGSARYGGSFYQLLIEATPVAPPPCPLQKTWSASSVHYLKRFVLNSGTFRRLD